MRLAHLICPRLHDAQIVGQVTYNHGSIIVLLAFAGGKGADFLVVDINYFPGYEKLPNHAALMVEFLQSLLIPSKDQGAQVQRHLSSCLDSPGSDSE